MVHMDVGSQQFSAGPRAVGSHTAAGQATYGGAYGHTGAGSLQHQLQPRPVRTAELATQTEVYLSELVKPTGGFEAETQTDVVVERPRTPEFLPAKVGFDIGCQVADLFDFDHAVAPIVEVLVAKTLQESADEVRQEAEIAELAARREAFLPRGLQQQLEVQRLEALERRRVAELTRRMAFASAQRSDERRVRRRVIANVASRACLTGLERLALDGLEEERLFSSCAERDLERSLIAGLLEPAARAARATADLDFGGMLAFEAVALEQRQRRAALGAARAARNVLEQASHELQCQAEEESRLAEEEAARVADEQTAMKRWAEGALREEDGE